MSHDTVDIYNPKVTRSTMGSIFRVPFVYVDDLLEVAETMKQKNIITYAHISMEQTIRRKIIKKEPHFSLAMREMV